MTAAPARRFDVSRWRIPWSPKVGLYLVAVVEQAFWSVLNLGVNLAVARFVSPEQFGAFLMLLRVKEEKCWRFGQNAPPLASAAACL